MPTKCGDKLSSDWRQEIFNHFYSMDEDTKNANLFHFIKTMKPKFLLCEAVRHRSISFAYYVTVLVSISLSHSRLIVSSHSAENNVI